MNNLAKEICDERSFQGIACLIKLNNGHEFGISSHNFTSLDFLNAAVLLIKRAVELNHGWQ